MRVGGGGEGRPSVIPELNFDPSLQLRIVERMVFVQILLRIEGREPLDLTEEVYTAGERKRGKNLRCVVPFCRNNSPCREDVCRGKFHQK